MGEITSGALKGDENCVESPKKAMARLISCRIMMSCFLPIFAVKYLSVSAEWTAYCKGDTVKDS